MPDPNYTHLVLIVDTSGSMHPIAADMEGSLHDFVAAQRKLPGKCTVSCVTFNSTASYETVFSTLAKFKPPTLVGKCNGGTALLGAIGATVSDVGKVLERQPEAKRPGKVLVVVITDGEENATHHHELMAKYAKPGVVKGMIEHQKSKYGWEFIFMGANQDAALAGANLGIAHQQTKDFVPSSAGVRGMGMQVNSYASTYRSTGKGTFDPPEPAPTP